MTAILIAVGRGLNKILEIALQVATAPNLTKFLHFLDEMRRQEEVYGLPRRVHF